MPPRRSRNFGPRRTREWAIISNPTAGVSMSDGANVTRPLLTDWLAERGLSRTAGLTISEIHGSVQVTPDAGETADFIVTAAAGIAFFPDTLSSVADFPNPRIESHSWQSHGFGCASFEAPDTPGVLITPTHTPAVEINMHTSSMRKQPDVRSELMLVVNQINSSVQSQVLTFQLRMLLLLP